MVEEKAHVHKLDELFGRNKDIVVEFEGKRYRLKHPDSFTPVEMNRFDHLNKRSEELHLKEKKELTDQEAEVFGEITKELVLLLNPRLGEKLTFLQQVSVIYFHARQVKACAALLEKKTDDGLIGAKSIPG